MSSELGFRLLGELEIDNGGMHVPLPAGKLRVVLATLLLRANETVSVDELIDRLWGDQAPAAARTTAQTYVMRLRQALGDDSTKPELIHTRPGGYLIRIRPEQLDLCRFRELAGQASTLDSAGAAATLREALRLWRGPALADIPSESLNRDKVPPLTEERLQCLERRVELDLEHGRHGELIAELLALTTEHPLRERFRYQLMLALFRSGRQADSLQCYRDFRDLLINELGIEPGTELQALHEAILRNDPRFSLVEPGRYAPVPPRSTAEPAPGVDGCRGWRTSHQWSAWSGHGDPSRLRARWWNAVGADEGW